MADRSPLLRQCLENVVAQSSTLLEHCLDVVVPDLQTAEYKSREVATRDRIGLAWRGLLKYKLEWLQTFPHVLKKRLMAAAAETGAVAPTEARRSSFADLSLVDDDKVAEDLESSRLLQVLMPAVEAPLSDLDALMSSLLGEDVIRPEMNPLRPEIFAGALREMLAKTEPDAEIRALCLRHLGKPFAAELHTLYLSATEQLRRANVAEAGYRVRLTVDAPGAGARPAARFQGGPGDGFGGGSGGGWGDGTAATGQGPGAGGTTGGGGFSGDDAAAILRNLPAMPLLARPQTAIQNHVFHEFLNQGAHEYDQALPQGYYQAVDDELAAIEHAAASAGPEDSAMQRLEADYRELPVVDRPVRSVDVGSRLRRDGWGAFAAPHERARALMQLKKKAERVKQVVGLDVVRKLVNQVAHDPLLLAPVREAVVALEPALLHLALDNPRFFSETSHPARRLVESVAQRSFRYNDEFDGEFASFFQPVQKVFNQLNTVGRNPPEAFGAALAKLQQGWDELDRQELEAHYNGLRAIRFAEERQTLADQIAWDLSQRPDLQNVPGMILDFLYGTWSLVMAHAQLMDKRSQIDPGGYRTAVSDLLWSVKQDVTLRRPSKLIEMIPKLVTTLHAGLELLGKERTETKPFFDALMRLHNPVLKLRRARSRRDAEESAFASLSAPAPLEPSAPAPREDAESMSMDIDETLPATPEQQKPRKAAQPWLGRLELDAAGFEETQPTDYGSLGGSSDSAFAELDTGAAPLSATDEDALNLADKARSPSAILDSLRPGAWVDLYSRRQWLRAQLMWASSKGTLFMFVSRGGRPHSMTKRSCEKLIRDRLMRPVETGAVVDKAIAAMEQKQDANSSRIAEAVAA